MIDELYLDTKVLKQLEGLRRSGKKAALAADRAGEIIAGLRTHGRMPDRAATPTRHGELRIKGVRKYDLGSGYRLATFRQGQRLFLLFAGAHDSCDRWLENNRELPLDLIETRCRRYRIRIGATAVGDSARRQSQPPLQSDDPLIAVDESDLRRIFCGLTGESV
ncbi:MAG: hypothetical protein P8010_02245 [Desulfosarcinaceae bacterium]